LSLQFDIDTSGNTMRNHRPFFFCLMAIAAVTLTSCGSSSKQGQVRLLNVSTGYNSLDLYANSGGNTTDTSELQGVGFETLSSYFGINSGTYAVKFRVHGATDTLETLATENFADQSHVAYVAYGSSGNFASVRISEDVGTPASGSSQVQMYNTAEAGALDVYLTAASTSLNDASPTFSNVASGATASGTINYGTYRLRVTAAGDKTDLRLDVASITFNNQQVSSVILTSTVGGVLVNAMYLPQQGSLTKFENTQARIRGAVGIANGTTVTASIGSLGLLSGATVGIIGATYGQLTAGTASVTLSVDGNAVAVANQTLTAGADYTLLVWSDANGTQTTLVSDDNHVPTLSTKLKIRLLNGMSGLGAPATLAANFSPVAQGIAVGQASSPTEIDTGSNYELDVSNASTGAILLSKTLVSLVAGDVYTMFVAGGGGTAAVVGTLHKDR
jgi:hypothetical protein